MRRNVQQSMHLLYSYRKWKLAQGRKQNLPFLMCKLSAYLPHALMDLTEYQYNIN